jgi:hypothetical protein
VTPPPARPPPRTPPGWQIALIAVGAALLAATVAVLVDRARTTRRPAAAAA